MTVAVSGCNGRAIQAKRLERRKNCQRHHNRFVFKGYESKCRIVFLFCCYVDNLQQKCNSMPTVKVKRGYLFNMGG